MRLPIAHASRLVRVAAVLGLTLAACGGGGSSAAPGTIPPGAIVVSADEYEFEPPTLTAPAGDVAFAVMNDGTENHEFEVMSGETSLGKIDASAEVGAILAKGDVVKIGRVEFRVRPAKTSDGRQA